MPEDKTIQQDTYKEEIVEEPQEPQATPTSPPPTKPPKETEPKTEAVEQTKPIEKAKPETKVEPLPKTEETVEAEKVVPKPQPEASPSVPQGGTPADRDKPLAEEPKQPTKPSPTPQPSASAKATADKKPVPSPVSNKPSLIPATSFMTKFKNKLAEFRMQANKKRAEKVEENLEKIMQYAKEKQKITNDEVEKITGVKDTQATNYLNILVKQGKLIRFGKKKNIFYKAVKQ